MSSFNEVDRLELLPQSDSIQLAYGQGWYPPAATNSTTGSRWTENKASISFANPGRDTTFFVEVAGRPDVRQSPASVELLVNGRTVVTFPLGSRGRAIHKIPLETAHLSIDALVELTIQVDREYVPARLSGGRRDTRELGVRVLHMAVQVR